MGSKGVNEITAVVLPYESSMPLNMPKNPAAELLKTVSLGDNSSESNPG